MKKKCLIIIIPVLLFLAHVLNVDAADFPKPQGYVNDFASILSVDEKAKLEGILNAFEKETSNEIVVVIVPSFDGLDRFTYSQKLFTEWAIGKKDKNNGVLFLVGPSEGLPFPERGEIFVNVGRGLEGALPDSLTGSILRAEVFPRFKEKAFALGIENGVLAIMKATKGEYKASESQTESSDGGSTNIMFFVWLGFMFLSWFASFLGRSKSWWLGGVIGAGAGGVLGFIFLSGFMIAITAGLLGGFGLLFDFIVSKNYAYRKAHGKPTDFLHSGGGFWFGGGRGGFGGGGGFGGFGGGRSGGGGAGGGW